MHKIYKENLSNRFMNFINKMFQGRPDESVHLQFQKFGKGEFRDRALINAKKSGNKYVISTTAEFVNYLVREIAEKLGSNKTSITGQNSPQMTVCGPKKPSSAQINGSSPRCRFR